MLKRISILFALLAISGCGNGDNDSPPLKSAAELAYIRDDSAISKHALDAAITPLFEDEEMAETRALVIMHRGEVIAEKYGEGFDAQSRFLGWSIAKSVTATLVGMMVADGRLVLDAPAPVPEWQRPGDPRGDITLRQLLNMASGLDHDESGAGEDSNIEDADTLRMLFLDGAQDMAAYARARPLESPPGSQYEYSTATTMILADIITRQLTESKDPDTRQLAAERFMQGRLFDPIGMDSAIFEFDAAGTFIGGVMIHASARDYATFGEFLRHKGAKSGAQHLPVRWVDFMRTPSDADPAYGGHLWLNQPRPAGRRPVLFPGRASENTFAARGHLGQYIVVVPEKKLTNVRLGKTEGENEPKVTAQIAAIAEQCPSELSAR